MKRKIISTVLVFGISTSISNALTDINNHWAKEQVKNFVNEGHINGYEDGTFRPNNQITRAEFLKIVNKYFELTKKSGKIYNDTINHWAKQEIDIAYTNGILEGIEGITNTNFYPNAILTREEASVMISNLKKIADTNLDKLSTYRDSADVSNWAKAGVEGMLENKYMNGYEDKTFRPKGNITRAEAVVTLSRISKELNNGSNTVIPETNQVYANGGDSTSNKYHKSPNAHNMEGAISMSKEEAQNKGYVPCGVCYK